MTVKLKVQSNISWLTAQTSDAMPMSADFDFLPKFHNYARKCNVRLVKVRRLSKK